MKRFGTRSATGKMVKLKLPVDVESLLIEASNRSGRSRSFEAVIRLKDHLHRYPKFNRAGNIYGKSLVKYLTMRLDDETNQLLIAAKNRSGLNRPGFPGECFICELRLPDHRFRWKHNKLFL
ncbi:TraY domain-containing protein, partial [Escherichia coli]|uniref:TraY domain-containing protein n=1 Tax=Escherichia coli TaxID=562 RepID=UPI00203A488C